jgi:lipoprotein-releasing system permease protein
MMVDGRFLLEKGDNDFAVVGNGIAGRLQLHLNDFENPIRVYFPQGDGLAAMNPLEAFSIENIFPSGVFSIQQEYDDQIVLTSMRFAQRLMNLKNEISSIEIKVKRGSNVTKIQEILEEKLGGNYVVKDRFQQKEMLYKIMKSEKWSSFMILGFILLIAIFNVVGSVTVLIIEKKKDIQSLKNMGATDNLIRKIFFSEGMMISVLGAVIGLTLGATLCLIQQRFGIIPMEGSFAVNSFPIEMQLTDFLSVFGLIIGIGFFATIVPVRRISKKYLS